MSDGSWYDRNAAWIVAIALMAIAIPSVWYVSRLEGFHNGYQQRQTEQIKENADSDLRGKCSLSASINEAINCAKGVVKTEAEQGHDARDLEAQWQSATWTKLMLFVTAALGTLTVILTYYGVVLLRATLHEAKLTTKAAIAGTDAARETVDQAKETNRIAAESSAVDIRPWVAADIELITPFRSSPDGQSFGADIIISVKNIGKTPAIDLKMWPKIILNGETFRRDYLDNFRELYSHVASPEGKGGSIVFPGAKTLARWGISISGDAIQKNDVFIRTTDILPTIVVTVFYKGMDAARIFCTSLVFDINQIHESGEPLVISPYERGLAGVPVKVFSKGNGFVT
jgi:hypothetical protein